MSIPDANGLIREWLREQPSIMEFTTVKRVYFAMPENPRPTLPCIVLVRVGGMPIDQIDYPRMSFSCWGDRKFDAGELAYELASVLDLATQAKPLTLNGGTVLSTYDVISPLDIQGVEWAKAMRVQASFMTRA